MSLYKKKLSLKIMYIAPGNSIHSYNWVNYFASRYDKIAWLSYHGYHFNGKFKKILDGQHRLVKAITNKESTVKIKVLDINSAPDDYKEMFS